MVCCPQVGLIFQCPAWGGAAYHYAAAHFTIFIEPDSETAHGCDQSDLHHVVEAFPDLFR